MIMYTLNNKTISLITPYDSHDQPELRIGPLEYPPILQIDSVTVMLEHLIHCHHNLLQKRQFPLISIICRVLFNIPADCVPVLI